MSARNIGLLVAMFLIYAHVVVAEVKPDSNRGSRVGPGSGVAVFGGITTADLGGASASGVALGAFGYPVPLRENFGLRVGIEYLQQVNAGEVARYSSGDGSLLYQGGGEVTLEYLQFPVEFAYIHKLASWALTTHAGLAPAFLVGQSVSTDEPSGSTFSSFDWYRSIDILALVGFTLQYHRLLVDLQVAAGLLRLESTEVRADGDWPGVPFAGKNGRSSSFRVGMGFAL